MSDPSPESPRAASPESPDTASTLSPASLPSRPPLPALIIFDKDGTLIEFHAMWSDWMEGLAQRLAAASGHALVADYLAHVGYDADSRRTLPGGRLAIHSMTDFRTLTVDYLHNRGVPDAAQVTASVWSVPDPIHAARPTTDLAALFTRLQAHGCRLVVATTDDHAPAVATLQHLGVDHFIEYIIGADDGVPIKPLPDMVLAHCQRAGLPPARTVVVGDSLDDMRMAKAAGALAIGVLTGLTSAAQIGPLADHLLDSIEQLPALFGLPDQP